MRSRADPGAPQRDVGPRHARAMLLAAALFVAAPGPAVADGDAVEGPNPKHPGYALFQSHCAGCHGVQADGTGPKGEHLVPKPADLRRLEGPGGGPVRRDDLARIIDGRRTLRIHDDGDMPVWGWVFVSEEPDRDLRERVRSDLVQTLADYVLSIQEPRPE